MRAPFLRSSRGTDAFVRRREDTRMVRAFRAAVSDRKAANRPTTTLLQALRRSRIRHVRRRDSVLGATQSRSICEGRSSPPPWAIGAIPRLVGASGLGGDVQMSLKQTCSRENPWGAMCVQSSDDSLNSAIRTAYRISLRSSSLREPRYPLLGVLFGLFL